MTFPNELINNYFLFWRVKKEEKQKQKTSKKKQKIEKQQTLNREEVEVQGTSLSFRLTDPSTVSVESLIDKWMLKLQILSTFDFFDK